MGKALKVTGKFVATLRCGDTLHVLVASTPEELQRMEATKKARLLRANGHTVVDDTGMAVCIIDEEVHPTVWHKDGNRVQARRVRYERTPEGETSWTVLRNVWINPVA